MSLGISKRDKNPTAHRFGNITAEVTDLFCDRSMIRPQHHVQIFRVEPRRKRCRADQVAKHDCQLPPFSHSAWLECRLASREAANTLAGPQLGLDCLGDAARYPLLHFQRLVERAV